MKLSKTFVIPVAGLLVVLGAGRGAGEHRNFAGRRRSSRRTRRRIAVAGRIRGPQARVPGPGADVGAQRPRLEGDDHRRSAAGDPRRAPGRARAAPRRREGAHRGAPAQAEKIKGFLADGQITQDELDQLPADSPLRQLTNLMDDGKITTDELQSIGRGLLGNSGFRGFGRGHGFGFGFGHDRLKPDASPAPSASPASGG